MRSPIPARRMARTTAMGLRRDPHPPKPMVMPVAELADHVVDGGALVAHRRPWRSRGGVRVALVDEGLALLVGHARDVELVGEPLLEAVAALHVDGVDAVERLLGPADDGGALRRRWTSATS